MTQKKQKKFSRASHDSTVNEKEIRQFDALGDTWWDEDGPMRPLHRLNPVRLTYIREQITHHFGLEDRVGSLKSLNIADIGCGGGLVAEPLARMGATVTGIDAGKENIRVAAAHAKAQGVKVEYLATSAEAVAAKGRTFDVVTALEIVEHVDNVPYFMETCCKLVRPGGLLIMSTLNRTPKSYMLGIVAAEYVLRWLPAGTHDWKKFMKPSELAAYMTDNKLDVADVQGLVYNPLTQQFSLSASDLAVNYFIVASK
ncbi:MAG: bifunctional 2-polyprenyl-6-hydroxyphenol methylase/3-demethylubiquinol 3-O-methyltransferase UbiG [Micavibrio sp.]|nr:bifunctional 2-polyprenyl-6-hydroxyphenol methylase/3-demethylubiquinol 3-O-methyltransferase UbiG [Micavibrio sp.]